MVIPINKGTMYRETLRAADVARELARGPMRGREFEACVFERCDLSGADLGGALFSDCMFLECRMTLTVLTDAVLRGVEFRGCVLGGIDFGAAAEFGFEIVCRDSRLDNCSFVRRAMRGARFGGGELRECYFAECDLGGALFDGCGMEGTSFERCDLSGADLRTASGWAIDPVDNRVRGARFASHNLAGLVASFGVKVE
jgi:uncharacterized protein YjbI with pentapeptide repeats